MAETRRSPSPGGDGPGPNPRERLLLSLSGQRADRPPVICPGGMMTMATQSAMRATGVTWPSAHADAPAMAELVLATQEDSGLECLSVPFCMTVEAEALGCGVDMGNETILPHVVVEPLPNVAALDRLPHFDPSRSGRAPVVLDALARLKHAATPYPVLGAVVGPVSLAAMVMEAGLFLRLTRRDPDAARRLIAAMEEVSLEFALAQHAAGADGIMIAEPTATGEVLGGAHFARFAAPALVRVLRSLRDHGAPSILHICGDLRRILRALADLAHDLGSALTLSVDAMVSGRRLQRELPGVVRMGNVDAVLLENGPADRIAKAGRRAARTFDIVAPACGLAPSTPGAHLRALVNAVRGVHGPEEI